MSIAIQNCTYGKSKHERKESHNQNHKDFTYFILNSLQHQVRV